MSPNVVSQTETNTPNILSPRAIETTALVLLANTPSNQKQSHCYQYTNEPKQQQQQQHTELSGVWCPLLAKYAASSNFLANNEQKWSNTIFQNENRTTPHTYKEQMSREFEQNSDESSIRLKQQQQQHDVREMVEEIEIERPSALPHCQTITWQKFPAAKTTTAKDTTMAHTTTSGVGVVSEAATAAALVAETELDDGCELRLMSLAALCSRQARCTQMRYQIQDLNDSRTPPPSTIIINSSSTALNASIVCPSPSLLSAQLPQCRTKLHTMEDLLLRHLMLHESQRLLLRPCKKRVTSTKRIECQLTYLRQRISSRFKICDNLADNSAAVLPLPNLLLLTMRYLLSRFALACGNCPTDLTMSMTATTSTAADRKRQMLVKWLISTLQTNGERATTNGICNKLNEQELNGLALQFCNNLKYVGVLKQISSNKQDADAFSPFEMYQWTHTEQPTTSLPMTPGKLDKATAWPYCSTPATSKIAPQISATTPATDGSTELKTLKQILSKRLLNCSTIAEVHALVNELLNVDELPRRSSKRCILLTDLLNESETTIYEYEKRCVETETACVQLMEVGVQTDEDRLDNKEATLKSTVKCCKCEEMQQNFCDKMVQTEEIETELNKAQEQKPIPPPPPPLPPPPPPLPNAALFETTPTSSSATSLATTAPIPPPPPPPILPTVTSSAPPPPPLPALSLNTAMAVQTSTATSPTDEAKSQSTTAIPSPAPLPNPSEGNWFHRTNTLRKNAVNPPKPMKPLYWTRIVTAPAAPRPPSIATSTDSTDNSLSSPDEVTQLPNTAPNGATATLAQPPPPATTKEIWQEIDETTLDNIDEFTELFSRQAVVPKSKPKEQKIPRVKLIKVLDSKRSQTVGIVSRSLHVAFFEIEHAIYHVDTSIISLETLQQICNIKATNEELELIREASSGDVPLDHPEQFLLKISEISMAAERISCLVFQAEFDEASTLLRRKLETVMQLSQYMVESEDLKLVFSIILTLGNYMNGGNRQRGQADGFNLDILGKLKDVKSKESQTTLLHFIVRTYIAQRRKEGVQLLEIPLPIPEPSDVERATQVDFDEVKQQINELNKKLNVCKKTTEKVVIAANENTREPFKSKMTEFIECAEKIVTKLYGELDECRELFIETMRFYHFAPKTRTLDQCMPDQFYECWMNFSNDFKDIWKKEIAILWNDLLKKSKQAQLESRKPAKTTKIKPGGLKERILRLSKK